MTLIQAQLCERLREDIALFKVARIDPGSLVPALAMIESQAKQIADYQSIVKQQALDYISLFDQCSEALDRVKALEAKCALMAASLAQEEARSVELQGKVAAAEKATRFAGIVLAEHRNDGYPGDVDGDFLQMAALQTGLIEERTVAEPCGERCSCAETISESEFPTVCYFNTDAGKAAIAASKEQS